MHKLVEKMHKLVENAISPCPHGEIRNLNQIFFHCHNYEHIFTTKKIVNKENLKRDQQVFFHDI